MYLISEDRFAEALLNAVVRVLKRKREAFENYESKMPDNLVFNQHHLCKSTYHVYEL